MADIYTRQAELTDVRQDAEQRNIYRFLVSTPGKKGDGLDIPVESWDLSRFTKHPNVLLNHNIMELPIGRAEKVWTDETGLWADVRFSNSNPKALEVRGLIDEGILSSTSVNFRPHDVDRQTGQPERTELVELSIVSVPEDADVLMARSMWHFENQIDHEAIIEAILTKINAPDNDTPDMGELELEFRDALRNVRHLAGQLSQLGVSDESTRETQDAIVALRVLLRIDEPNETDAQETDYSDLLALIGA